MDPDSGKVQSLEEIFGRELRTPADLIEAQRLAKEQGLVQVSEEVAAATTIGLRPKNRKRRRNEKKRQRAKQRQIIRNDRRKRRKIIRRARTALKIVTQDGRAIIVPRSIMEDFEDRPHGNS